jgi:hypothetical protein
MNNIYKKVSYFVSRIEQLKLLIFKMLQKIGKYNLTCYFLSLSDDQMYWNDVFLYFCKIVRVGVKGWVSLAAINMAGQAP